MLFRRYYTFAKEPVLFVANSPLRFWFYLFFAINLAFGVAGGSNAGIRFATLCAMAEDHSFQIDPYQTTSVDWAQTPDGHYYSTKAPGPAFLAFPLYFILDKVVTFGVSERAERDRLRLHYKGITQPIISFSVIALPFAWVACLALSWLASLGVSFAALELAALAMLFGNTADFFMNTFFNHAITAGLLIALAFALMKRSYRWVGFLFGWALLTEYSVAPLLLVMVWIVFRHSSTWQERAQATWQIAMGAIFPAVLWIWYHVTCFGSPFALPYKYVNPLFADSVKNEPNLWGAMGILPKPRIAAAFLFGFSRGIFWVEPWVLLICFMMIRTRNKIFREATIFANWFGWAFLLFLWLFSCYGVWWHGGDTPGPRFLSAAFPGYAVLLGLAFDRLSQKDRWLAKFSVGVAVLFYIVVFSVLLFAPPGISIWRFYLGAFFSQGAALRWGRLGILFTGFATAFYFRRQSLSHGFDDKTTIVK